MYDLPSPNELFSFKECGYSIGDWVWIKPNSSDWSEDWRNVKLMIVGISWKTILHEWQFECISEDETDILFDLSLDDLTRYNMWE